MKTLALWMGLLLCSLASASGEERSLRWWTPPKTIDRIDRLGYSEAQILHMGLDKWSDIAYKFERGDGSKWEDSVAFGVDGTNIVYGLCLAHRNDRLIARLPVSRRTAYRRLRQDLFYFAMACIAMEDTLAGGGTYSIHWPRYISRSQELLLYAMLTRQKPNHFPPNEPAKFLPLLSVYRSAKASHTLLRDIPVRANELHGYARLATKYLRRSLAAVGKLAPEQRPAANDFVQYWLVEYLDIRHSDRIVLPSKLVPKLVRFED